MSHSNSILIVGGGPTGLVIASELTRHGVACRIIDRLDKPIETSRSFTIHARTLELLDQMGIADQYLERGHKAYSMDYHFQNMEEVPQLDFTELDGSYPFCLVINQNETEALLHEQLAALGGGVEWQTRLTSLQQDEDGRITVTLAKGDDDQEEVIHPDWLIGCDGTYSTVRNNLNIPFDGAEYTGMEIKMMDVPMDGFDYSSNRIHYFISKNHLLLICRLPDSNYRLFVSETGDAPPTETVREAFQALADHYFDGSVQLGEPNWATNFKISRRQANTYRHGRVFLAGDSAHVNSPAGGQGMNVSMQDGFNLAWKLALVAKGEALESLLDSYEKERAPVAAQMLEGTQYLHSIIMAHGQGMAERIALTRQPGWNKQAVSQIAGISYTYRDSIDTAAGADAAVLLAPLAGPAAGDRAPDASFAESQSVYRLLHETGHTLFLFLGDGADMAAYEALLKIARQAADPFKATIAARIIVTPSFAAQLVAAGAMNDQVVVDSNGQFHQQYGGADKNSIYLIRPDRHIGYCCRAADQAYFFSYLARIFK